jgi:putative colanic acid biosynthesis UDP-glucose lipid carrier transferase
VTESQRFIPSGHLKANAPHLSLVQRLADVAIIVGTHWAACDLYYRQEWNSSNTLATAMAVAVFYLAAQINGLYRAWRGAPVRKEGIQVLIAWGVTVPILLFVAFATKTTANYSRVVSTGWFISAPVALIFWRVGVRNLLRSLRARGYNTRTVAIAGATRTGERLLKTLHNDPALGLRVAGVYDDRTRRRRELPESLGRYVGTLDQMLADARKGVFDIVYIALPLRAEKRITSLVSKLADTTATVEIVPEFYAYDLLHARWGTVGDIQVVSIFDTPFDGVGGWLKRVEDALLGSMAVLLTALPMLVVAILIKLDSRGPIFFQQTRYGLNGKPIRVLKFRTMRVIEDGNNVPQAQKNDPRVTRLGAFLRRTSMDELPQFFNVLAGHMSIVGPRPHAVVHNELYRAKIHGYMLRHKVKPGITGWAQVNGWRGETDTVEKMEKRIEHDLDYINNWRLGWDLKIMWLTVFGKAARSNAY